MILPVPSGQAQSIGQWNVNNSLNWYNSTAWLNFAPISGIGTGVLLNQDIGQGARYAADVVQTFTAAATGLQQQIQLSAIPVNNSLFVTDTTGAFTWSQARGSNTTAWTVNYDATLNQVQITYTPAVTATRAITIGYATGNATSTLGSFRDLGGMVELVGTTAAGTTVYKKVLSQAVNGTKLATHDGVVFVNGTASNGTFTTTYNATTREVTVTYAASPAAGRKIIVGYIPLSISVGAGNTSVTPNSVASTNLFTFTRELPLVPNLDSTFITTDGTFTATNGISSSPTDFTVSYTAPTATALPKVVTTYKTVTALNAITGVRPIKIDFTSPVGSGMVDVAGLTERVAVGTGALTTFTRTLNQFVNGDELGVTDGTYFWKSGVGSSNPQFTVTYDPVSRLLTVNYGSLTPPSTSVNIIAAYIPKGQTGTATVSVNTTASGTPIIFARSLTATPAQDVTFKVLDGFYTWTNGTVTGGATTTDFDVAYNSGSKTITTTYKSTASITNIGAGRTLSATYNAASIASKNVTVGTMLMGDVNSTDRMNLALNSLTFDNGGANATSQLNKISGVADEIAGNVKLDSSLTMAVRTGGDVVNKNAFLISANISGTGALTKVDSGNLIIAGNNTFTGPTIIRNTGGTTFLNASSGSTALASQDIYLGTASRDGHAAMVLQTAANTTLGTAGTVATNQIADTSRLWFDGGSGRNPYYRMFGTSETVGGIFDSSTQGVIENTEGENGVAASSKLTVNMTNASESLLYNGFMRNKASGDSTGILTLDKAGPGRLVLQGGNINFGDSINSTLGIDPLTLAANSQNRVTGGTLALVNTSNFGSDIVVSSGAKVELGTTSDWTFNRSISGAGELNKIGANVAAIARNQTYTGATTIEGGTLRITNQLLSEGMTAVGSNFFFRTLNRVPEAGSLRVTLADGTSAFFGIPKAGVTLTYDSGTRLFTASFSSAPSGAVNAQYVIQGTGSLASTSAINILTGTLQIVNDQNSNLVDSAAGGITGRINDSAGIFSNGGTINFDTRRIDNTTFAETLGGLTLQAGRTTVSITNPAVTGLDDTGINTKAGLTFASLTRQATATTLFTGPSLGETASDRAVSTIKFTSAPVLNDGIIGGWAVASGPGGGGGLSFATYSNGTVSPLDVSAYRTSVANVNGTGAWQATDNVRIRGATPNIPQLPGTPPPLTVNSLFFDDTTARTLTIGAGRALVVDSGGILSPSTTSNTQTHTIAKGGSGTSTGYLTAGAGNNYELDLYVDTGRRLIINAPIQNNGTNAVSVVKSGQGKVFLNGSGTLFSGGLIINEGTIDITGFSALGRTLLPGAAVPNFLTMNGGMLQVQNDSRRDDYPIVFESQYGITLGKAGGRFTADTGVTFYIESQVTGSGGLTMGDTGALDGSNGGVLDLRGQNNFQGGITVNQGDVILGGSVLPVGSSTPIAASNTFKGPITINGGSFTLRTTDALPVTRPDVISSNIGKLFLLQSGSFGSISGDGIVDTGTDKADNAPTERVLKITQDINTTYGGDMLDGGGPVLSLEKWGKGVLSLTSSNSRYHGATRIYEGVLQVAGLNFRGPDDRTADPGYASSIGLGNYDKDIAGGSTLLALSKGSADNLLIGNGAALSFAGTFEQLTDRPFTIGTGPLGASLLANSAAVGSAISWLNRPMPDSNGVLDGSILDPIKYDQANQAATLNLGGRNQGLNRFGKDLHDNGTAPLSLTKTGDGQWILGAIDRLAGWVLETTRSRNDFKGSTTIYQGTLGVEQNGVFGADMDQGGSQVNLIGGILDLRNVDYQSKKTLALQGGRLRTPFGTNSWAGDISLDITSVIETTGTSTLKLGGTISGRAGVTKQGFGTMTLVGNNTFLGGVAVQEGTLRLDYNTNTGSKLADGANVSLGGGRQGATLDIVGGTSTASPIIEIIGSMNLNLGQNRITRSDAASTTIVRLNALENARVNQGATLDIAANNIAQTDRLNDSSGILGTWMTVAKSDWAKNNGNGVAPIPAVGAPDGFIVGLTNYSSNTWDGGGTNTTVTSSNTVTNGLTNTLRFAEPTAINLTLVGNNTILSDGILQAPSTAGKSNIVSGGSLLVKDNGFGGNLMIHQNDPVGSLTIDSAIANAPAVTPVTGKMYASATTEAVAATVNKLMSTPSDVADLSPGQLVTGDQIEPNTVISAIDYTTGEITLNQGRTKSLGSSITIQAVPGYTGDVLIRPTSGSIRQIRLTGSPTGNFNTITSAAANTVAVSGTGVPSSTIASFAADPVNPNYLIITLANDIVLPAAIPSFTLSPTNVVKGQMYFNGQINRYRVTPASALTNLSVGMTVQGDRIEDFTVISSIDFAAGDIFLSAGRNVDTNVTFTINGTTTNPLTGATYAGETMVANAQNRIRLKTGASFDLDNGLVAYPLVGHTITGGSIPAGTTIIAMAVDPNNPAWALVTLSQNISIPAIIPDYALTFFSRNGVAKFGDGTLILGGASTYTGPTYITGGKINVKTLTNGGVAGPLGSATNAAGNLVLSGGTLGYIGDSTGTDRGFTINETGTIEIARQGSVATFTGNISGGTGLGQGVLQVSGQGTTKISHIGGNVSNSGTTVIPAQGGSTSLGGISVNSGTLQFAYNNPNSNNSSNRFAASNAALTMAGGKLELVGLANIGVPSGTNPSENRTQQLTGRLTLAAGSSVIEVTGNTNTTTTLILQDQNNSQEIIRQAGSSVHFSENPRDGTADIFLSIPSYQQLTALPWATYLDTSNTDHRGINDFAAVEANDAVLNADAKNIYKLRTDVSTWAPLTGNSEFVVSEYAISAFGDSSTAGIDLRDPSSYNTTPSDAKVYGMRYISPLDSTLTIADKLTLKGGAILVGSDVTGGKKLLTGGQLTAGSIADSETLNPWNNGDGSADLLIHNYNASTPFMIASRITNNLADSPGAKENAVVGTMYFGGEVNRFRANNPLLIASLKVGTPLTGRNLEFNTTVASVDYATGDVYLSKNRPAVTDDLITVNGTTEYTANLVVLNSRRKVRITSGPVTFDANGNVTSPSVGSSISSSNALISIPVGSTIVAVARDPDNSSGAIVTISQDIPLPAPSTDYTIGSPYLRVNLVQTGWGTTYLKGDNIYTGDTYVNNGVLRLGSANAIPGGIDTTGGTSNIRLDGGVIGLEAGNFTRALGTGAAAVQFTGSGGFAAYRATGDTAASVVRDVNFGGSGDGVIWGANGFVPGGQILKLSNSDADATIRIVNPIDLVGGYRQVSVANSKAAIDAELAGGLSGNGGILAKLGMGTLFMSAGNSHTGGTLLGQGTLIMKGSVTSPVAVGSIDATLPTDVLTLQVDGAAMNGGITFANKNSSGTTNLRVSANSTAAGGIDVQRNVYVDAQVGRTFTVSGAATGGGRLFINEGGVFGLNGVSTFGSAGSTQGTAIDGAIVVRNGTVQVGSNTGLGIANVELGDVSSTLSTVRADRSTAGRSLLEVSGVYNEHSNGALDDVSGFGAFIYAGKTSLIIDGKTYTTADALAGTRILVNGEADHPERNGVYEFVYISGINSAFSLRRVAGLRQATEIVYGTRVTVNGGTDAGKTFFLANDRLRWTLTSTGDGRDLHGIAEGGTPNVLVAVGDNGAVLTSPDNGVSWNPKTVTPAITDRLNAVVATVSDLVAVGNNGKIIRSSGGFVWVTAASGVTKNLTGVAVKGTRFCAVGEDGTILTSDNAASWTTRSSGVTTHLRSVAASLIRFVAVGDGGQLVTSDDGVTWTPVSLSQAGFSNNFTHVTWTGSVFIIVGSMGETYVSDNNGVSWIARNPTAAASNAITAVAGTNRVAAAVGANGAGFLTATEGSAWASAPTRTTSSLDAITVISDGTYFAVGAGGTVATIRVPEDVYGHILIGTPVLWKEETNINPNVSLLASAAGITVANNADINSTNGSGATTLGGAAGLTGGGATFTGTFTLQDLIPGSGTLAKETRSVRLASESNVGHGIEFSGTFNEADSNDSLTLVKVGTGTVTLSGTNLHKGGTQVNAGTLLVNTAFGTGTGTGAVTVTNFGSVLGGTGSISGNTTLTSGASLRPGDPSLFGGIGQMNLGGALTMGAFSSMLFELNSPLSYDRLSIAGLLSVDPTSTISVLLNFLPTLLSGESLTFDLIDWGSLSVAGTLADNLDLPALASPLYYWDTKNFNTTGEIVYRERDGSGTPPVHFAVKEGKVSEEIGTVKVAVELDWSPTTPVTVPLVFGSGTGIATLGTSPTTGDYSASATSLTFNVGERTKELVLTIRDDAATESTEKAVVSLNAANKTTPSTFTLTIVDNDSALALGEKWTLRNPMMTNETLNSVAQIGTTFVAVGSQGTILTSANGIAWAKVPLAITPVINAMATDGTTLVAVGQAGRVLTTSDGASWTIRSCGGGRDLLGVTWTGSKFVAVGTGGVAYTSTDGMAWTFIDTDGNTADLEGVATTASLLVTVGQSGTVLTSSDNGDTWIAQTSNASGKWLRAVAYNGTSRFVAVGDNGAIITSPDGLSWTAPGSTGITSSLKSIRWEGSAFITAGAGGRLYTSTDGSTWTQRTSGVTDDLRDAAKLGTLYVAVGSAGTLLTSTDADTWTERSTGDTRPLRSIATVGTAAGAQLVAVGASGTVLTSGDSTITTWTTRTLPGGISNARFNAVAATASVRVMVGDSGAGATSTDGITWTSMTAVSSANLNGIAAKGTTFCAVGNAGAVQTSLNGAAWVDRTDVTFIDDFRAIATDGARFLAVGTNGAMRTSPDGITWTTVDNNTSATFNAVTFTGTQWIAVGNGGVIFTSLDAANWEQRISGLASTLNGVSFSGNTVVAVGLNGAATVSIDGGLTWTRRDTGTSINLQAVIVSAAGKFIAVGDGGTVITTETTLPPSPAVFFANSSDTVSEAVGTWNVPVMLNPPTTKKVTVPFTIRSLGSTATKTTDYTIAVTSVVFNPGETIKYIPVVVKNDALPESTEQIILDLGTPTGVTGITKVAPVSYTLSITDEHLAPTITAAPGQSTWIVTNGTTASPALDLTVQATGSQVLSVQWLRGGTTKLGLPVRVANSGDTMHYTVANPTVTDAGIYSAKVINPLQPTGGTGVSVAEIAVIERKPGNQLVLGKTGSTVSLTAVVGGSSLSYMWYRNSVSLNNDTADFVGVRSKTLQIRTLDATEQAIYKCRVTSGTLTAQEFTTSFKVVIAQTPDITPPNKAALPTPTAYPAGRVGTPYSYQITRASTADATTPVSYSITGLTSVGLTYNTSTGLISGTPTASGDFAITVKATNPQATTTAVTGMMHIDAMHTNAIGTFVALAGRSGSHTTNNGTLGLGGRITVTTAKNGTFTGSLTTYGSATSFTAGKINTTVPALPVGTVNIARTGKSTLTLTFTIDTATNLITGTLTDTTTSASLSGWRSVWGTSNPFPSAARAGTHNFMASIPASLEGDAANPDIPQGDSYASATVSTTGTVSISGRMADNTVITGSAPMGPSGQFLVHQGIYTATNPGSVAGIGTIAQDTGHTVTGSVTWSRSAQLITSILYKNGFGAPIDLTLDGGLYKAVTATTGTGIVMDGKATGDNFSVSFFDTNGLALDATTLPATIPNLSSFRINSIATPVALPTGPTLSMSFTVSTGLFTGSFTLKDSSGVSRKTSYYGMIIPDPATGSATDGIGAGFFVLNGLTATSAQKSGRVTLTPLP